MEEERGRGVGAGSRRRVMGQGGRRTTKRRWKGMKRREKEEADG